MTITQHRLKPLNLAALEASLRRDEHIAAVGVPFIACDKTYSNAVIIADSDGNVTGWLDGDVPVCICGTED